MTSAPDVAIWEPLFVSTSAIHLAELPAGQADIANRDNLSFVTIFRGRCTRN